MNRKSWTAILLWATLLLAMALPSMAADETPPKTPDASPGVRVLPGEADPSLFKADPEYAGDYDADAQLEIYGGKHMNKTSQAFTHGIRLYDRGAYTPRPIWLGATNPINYSFMAYGDVRFAGTSYDRGIAGANGKTRQEEIAARLNLDMDLALTATERFHAFVRPLDKNGSFTRYQFGAGAGDDKFVDQFDFNLNTLFFEGDIGQMIGGFRNKAATFDLPVVVGRVPLLTQNGIWLQDAFDGGAIGITAHNNPRFDISNYDITFFAGFNDVTTAAVTTGKTKMFGLAGFADMHRGYAEFGYGYVAADNHDQSYHNLTAAFTKRYFGLVANTVRVIGNVGQKGIAGQPKTADGVLLLLENSFTRPNPVTVVPYVNFFAGFNHPQPLARAADIGGVLVNTGINFESDGMTNYPTLDPFAQDSFGGAVGWEYLFDLSRQIVLEAAVVERMNGSNAGAQYAIGARYQHKLNNAWIVRFDAMRGWLAGKDDIYGARIELRRKF
ncbi:MAG: hypothetical protein M3Q69_01580 [Acidobacteriota bacterium]|nr:hypothetical protein [Acidobacteriota bacterium]